MKQMRAADYRAIGNELSDKMWHVVASIGDAIDNERIHTDRQWKIYANELHEWISSLLVDYQEAVQ